MTVLENPPSYIVCMEAQKAASDNGYRLERGVERGWLHYASTTAPGSIWIAGVAANGPWLLSIDHSGAAAEIEDMPRQPIAGPGVATFMIATSTQLHAAFTSTSKQSAV